MKRIGLLLVLVLVFTACSSKAQEIVDETVAEPVRHVVGNDAKFVKSKDSTILIVDADQTLVYNQSGDSLSEAPMYHQPLLTLDSGEVVFFSGDQLLRQSANANPIILVDSVQDVKVQGRELLVIQSNNQTLSHMTSDGVVHSVVTLDDQVFENLFLINQQYLIENHPDESTFSVLELTEQKESIAIDGQAIYARPNQTTVLFQSNNEPGKLGSLDVSTGEITWFSFGNNRTKQLMEPLIRDNQLMTVFENGPQAELILFNFNQQEIQSTMVGPVEEYLKLTSDDSGLIIHTKNRIYLSEGSTMNSIEYSADQVIRTERGLLLTQNNHIRVIVDNSFKDYQFPGKVLDAQLDQQLLYVLYTGPEGKTLVVESIDF